MKHCMVTSSNVEADYFSNEHEVLTNATGILRVEEQIEKLLQWVHNRCRWNH